MLGEFNPEVPAYTPLPEIKLRADAEEFVPASAVGWVARHGVLESFNQMQKRRMPFASEEEWEIRVQKRTQEVNTIKSLQSYRLYVDVFPRDKRTEEDPMTPDPSDRSISKRTWKWNVEKWRLQLKSRCVYPRAIVLQHREFMQQA